MCAYPGKEIADAFKAYARAEHEAEELVRHEVKFSGSRLPAEVRTARAILERSGDTRALALLDRQIAQDETDLGLINGRTLMEAIKR
jgi:hypothetical protein